MLDIGPYVERFIATEWRKLDDDNAKDSRAVKAVHSLDMDPSDRRREVLSWLHYYKVLMFFPPSRSDEISRQTIQYFDEHAQIDEHGQIIAPADTSFVLPEFERLYQRLQQVAPTKNGALRGVTSLTSKALWLCYPSAVPIFDSHALRALLILSRLSGLTARVEANSSDYARFVDVWFQVYEEVKHRIDRGDLRGCEYKIRVFDRFLWDLGQPSFNLAV